MNNMRKLIAALGATALLAAGGCSSQKGPATEAVAGAEASLTAIRDDAARYRPGQLQEVDATLTSVKDSLAQKDYKAVLDKTPALNASIDKLRSDVTAAQERIKAAQTEWTSLSADVPKLLDTLQARLETLSKARRLPKGIDKAALASGREGLELARSTWNSATAVSAEGKPVDAVRIAGGAKVKAEEVLKLLGEDAG